MCLGYVMQLFTCKVGFIEWNDHNRMIGDIGYFQYLTIKGLIDGSPREMASSITSELPLNLIIIS